MDYQMNAVAQDSSFWAELEEIDCPCQGDGWANINDEWGECPIHFHGQLHPESRDLLLDDPKVLAEAERQSTLSWRLEKARHDLNELQVKVRHAQYNIHLLELEKVNRTATTKMEVVKMPENCYPTVQMKAVRPEEFDFSDTFKD